MMPHTHVWTAPAVQAKSDGGRSGCSHVSGLSVRRIWPLALMKSAIEVPINGSRSGSAWVFRVALDPGSTGSSSRLSTLHTRPSTSERRQAGSRQAAAAALNTSPRVSTAHAIRAVLLARATDTTRAG